MTSKHKDHLRMVFFILPGRGVFQRSLAVQAVAVLSRPFACRDLSPTQDFGSAHSRSVDFALSKQLSTVSPPSPGTGSQKRPFSNGLFLSKPQAWHIITARSAVYIISPFGAVYHARARSPFARWHSVLRSVFDGTLAEPSARGSLVQARTHSRLIITRQRVSSFGLIPFHTSC